MATPELEFNPYDPAFNADPYPTYHRLRAEDPVHRTPMGFWILTRYDDVATVLRDARFGRKGFDELIRDRFGENTFDQAMLFRDPPDHTRLRALVNKAFTPRVIEEMRAKIQKTVDRLLDGVRDARAMDVIADLAYPLPVSVISEMLGVPAEDRDLFRGWSADIARSLDAIVLPTEPEVVERGNAARHALSSYFRALIAERRRRPQRDLLSDLIAAEEQGDKLSEEELMATILLLFVAGHETTVNLIGNGTLALLRNPNQLEALRRSPALIGGAIEELLRYDAPVQRTGRMPNTDVELGGKRIAKGDLVLSLIGAANRDPAHFAEPDRLDLARADNRHLAFGWGIHFCLGAPLARAEAQAAIGTIARRMPALALATPTPDWREASALRGLKTLPVTF
ncbi:MAG: cytochrome P450 [Candidatus Rokuibacteriota bacterium]|nr:MAG: cytochrome P450 [Candidatus Rokubacteria bacterium]PYN54816.1 MAG: cytochrome P450 [Candidatus Rokubacteria bacterium]